jgi:hypothetical protein
MNTVAGWAFLLAVLSSLELMAIAVSLYCETTPGFWWKIYCGICFFNALA